MKIQSVKNMAIGIGIMILVPLVTDVGIRLVIEKPSSPYSAGSKKYETNYFYIASSVGIVSIIVGVIAPAALGMGFVLGGVFSLVLGYVTAWDVISDLFKFITLLIALILLVLGSFKMIKTDT